MYICNGKVTQNGSTLLKCFPFFFIWAVPHTCIAATEAVFVCRL